MGANAVPVAPCGAVSVPDMTIQLLDNVVWHSLAGPHAKFAVGTDAARRYAPGLPPIMGFVEAERPDFASLAPFCAPGEHFYVAGWRTPAPAGWTIEADTTGHQLLWDAAMPAADDALAAIRLGAQHVAQMEALVAIAPPGPFAARNIELGAYYGVFDGDRLVAMAGERMEAGAFREVSAVSTHPDYQGRGYARRLVERLVRLQLKRGQMPFLHVMRDNVHARRLYERIGFRHHQELVLRIVARSG